MSFVATAQKTVVDPSGDEILYTYSAEASTSELALQQVCIYASMVEYGMVADKWQPKDMAFPREQLYQFIQPSQLETVKACFNDPATQIATLVKPFTADNGFETLENVNSPKVVLNKNMNALYFSRSIIPYQRNVEKCEWLKNHIYYKHIGLYAYRLEVLKEITALPQSSLELAESLEQLRWLENGYTIKAGITEVETIGIDTPQDLERAERFLLDRAAK